LLSASGLGKKMKYLQIYVGLVGSVEE